MSANDKRVVCVCKRCGTKRLEYNELSDEPYLCERCWCIFVAWRAAAAETGEEKYRTLESFLARRPPR